MAKLANKENIEWRTIEEAPNYEISNYGDVRNRTTGTLLAGSLDKDGYPRVMISRKDEETGKMKKLTRYRHRLVAQAFIPNPDNLPQVNHIDEDKGNPYVENLEWCSARYNVNYGEGAKRRLEKMEYIRAAGKGKLKPGTEVYVYDFKTHEFIGNFKSISGAARDLKCDYRSVYKIAHGEGRQHHGMIFSLEPIEFDN